jgi:signal transduction histidine kinase
MHSGKVGPVSDSHREYLGDVLTSAQHLLHLINDILDLSKVESGMMTFVGESVDLAELFDEIRDMFAPAAAGRQVTVERDISAEVGRVMADRARLKQILANYVSNAIKFGHDGATVTIRAFAEGADEFRIEVADQGPGIAAADLPKLFVEFQQLDSGAAKAHQGTGLGLALTRQLVEAQGGRVGVRSTLGSGSVFFAVLPK